MIPVVTGANFENSSEVDDERHRALRMRGFEGSDPGAVRWAIESVEALRSEHSVEVEGIRVVGAGGWGVVDGGRSAMGRWVKLSAAELTANATRDSVRDHVRTAFERMLAGLAEGAAVDTAAVRPVVDGVLPGPQIEIDADGDIGSAPRLLLAQMRQYRLEGWAEDMVALLKDALRSANLTRFESEVDIVHSVLEMRIADADVDGNVLTVRVESDGRLRATAEVTAGSQQWIEVVERGVRLLEDRQDIDSRDPAKQAVPRLLEDLSDHDLQVEMVVEPTSDTAALEVSVTVTSAVQDAHRTQSRESRALIRLLADSFDMEINPVGPDAGVNEVKLVVSYGGIGQLSGDFVSGWDESLEYLVRIDFEPDNAVASAAEAEEEIRSLTHDWPTELADDAIKVMRHLVTAISAAGRSGTICFDVDESGFTLVVDDGRVDAPSRDGSQVIAGLSPESLVQRVAESPLRSGRFIVGRRYLFQQPWTGGPDGMGEEDDGPGPKGGGDAGRLPVPDSRAPSTSTEEGQPGSGDERSDQPGDSSDVGGVRYFDPNHVMGEGPPDLAQLGSRPGYQRGHGLPRPPRRGPGAGGGSFGRRSDVGAENADIAAAQEDPASRESPPDSGATEADSPSPAGAGAVVDGGEGTAEYVLEARSEADVFAESSSGGADSPDRDSAPSDIGDIGPAVRMISYEQVCAGVGADSGC